MQQQTKTGLPSLSTSDKPIQADRVSSAVNDSNNLQAETQGQNLRVSALLMHGETSALTSAALCSALGCDARQLRHLVRAEREQGQLILSSNSGYFLPSLDTGQAHEEVIRCYKRLSSHTFSAFPFLRRLGDLLNISPQQITLDGVVHGQQTEQVSEAGI